MSCLSSRCHYFTDEGKAPSRGSQCFIYLVYRNLCLYPISGESTNRAHDGKEEEAGGEEGGPDLTLHPPRIEPDPAADKVPHRVAAFRVHRPADHHRQLRRAGHREAAAQRRQD